MQIITQNSNNNYEMTEEQYFEIQEATHNIGSLLDIMHDYCDYNMSNGKLSILTTMVEYMQSEKRRISGKF